MNIFHRYVVREHITPFLYAFFVIMFVLILKLMLDLMDMIISKHVDIITMAKLLVYNLAWMIALVVPMSVLVATVMAYGRMAAANEIVAMKAAGISMLRLSSPIIGISILITIFMVWFNNRILPDANQKTRDLQASIILKKPMLSLKNRERQFISDIQNFTIRVDSLNYDTGEMYGIMLFRRSERNTRTAIRAASGHFISNEDQDRLTIVLDNGEIHQINDSNSSRYVRGRFSEFKYNINFNFGMSQQTAVKNDRTMTSAEMREEIARFRGVNNHLQDQIRKFPRDKTGTSARQRNLENDIYFNEKRISQYLIEIHKKNSIPFAAIVFVLIGAPLGILVKRSGASFGISMSIGFFVIYYLFLIGGETVGDRMIIKPWLAMWAPNIFLVPLGVLLFIYATRK